MSREKPNNLRYYDNLNNANYYLGHPVTDGERRMCDDLLESAGPVLEVGCGAGRLFDSLARVEGGWFGIDYAKEPLRVLAERRRDARFAQADATDLPFVSDSFGSALLGYHMIESILPGDLRLRALREAARVVVPGGMIFLTRHRRHRYQPLAQITAFAAGRVADFGDLVGPARAADMHVSFRMHVLSEAEMARLARAAHLVRVDRWDFHTGRRVSLRSVSVVERYTFDYRAKT